MIDAARACAPLFLVFTLGCAGQPLHQGLSIMPPDLEQLHGYPSGTDPIFEDLGEREVTANEAFDRAVDAYAAGRHLEAARGFLAAAAVLADRADQPLRELFTSNRRACYINAERAFRRASATAEARVALTAAAAADPENAATLRDLVAGLPP